MSEANYRDDDTPDKGFCPRCYQELEPLTTAATGFCATHGWVFAEWFVPPDKEDEHDGQD